MRKTSFNLQLSRSQTVCRRFFRTWRSSRSSRSLTFRGRPVFLFIFTRSCPTLVACQNTVDKLNCEKFACICRIESPFFLVKNIHRCRLSGSYPIDNWFVYHVCRNEHLLSLHELHTIYSCKFNVYLFVSMVTIKTDLVLFYFTDHTPLYCIEIARCCLRKITNFKSFSFDGFSDCSYFKPKEKYIPP